MKRIVIKVISIIGCIIFKIVTLLFGLTSVLLLFADPISALIMFVLTLFPLALLLLSIFGIVKTSKKRQPPQNNGQNNRAHNRRNLAIEDIPGYILKYEYKDVEVCSFEYVPRYIQVGNRVVLFQEPTNPYDDKAVRLMFVPQRRCFGYLYCGRMQDMVNDYLNRGDKITARLSCFQLQPFFQLRIDIAFYRKIDTSNNAHIGGLK